MAKQAIVRVEVDQLTLRRLVGKLSGRSLFGADLRALLRETAEEGAVRVQSRAPLGRTMALWGSVEHALDPQPVPTWAKVTAGATNRGFRYGWALEDSKRIVYRHRGKKTRRWFRGARPWIKKRVQHGVARLAGSIASRWRR